MAGPRERLGVAPHARLCPPGGSVLAVYCTVRPTLTPSELEARAAPLFGRANLRPSTATREFRGLLQPRHMPHRRQPSSSALRSARATDQGAFDTTAAAAQQRTGGIAHETGELHRLLVESVQDYAIFALDPEGYILSWNPGAERFKGY